MRMIDADEIKYEVHEKLGLGIDYSIDESDVFYVAYKHQIDSIPTINPVKHGRWIKHKDGYYRCSECGSRGSAIKAHYCHHCGADMRG